MKKPFVRKLILVCALLFFLAAVSPFFCDAVIRNAAEGKLYDDVNQLPEKHTGLLLGTAKFLRDGQTENPYYRYRIQAAATLLKAGKIQYLVISGDNSRKTYSEPDDMRKDLMALGIDSNRLFLDYAGFRTFDSVVRLRAIFNQSDVCIISQKFHNERALYIAQLQGIEAVAYNAQDVGKAFGFKVMVREKFARVNVFTDYLLFTRPKFLGPPVSIPERAR